MATVNFRVVNEDNERIRIVYDLTDENGKVVATQEADPTLADALGEGGVVTEYLSAISQRVDELGEVDLGAATPDQLRTAADRFAEISSSLYQFANRPQVTSSTTA